VLAGSFVDSLRKGTTFFGNRLEEKIRRQLVEVEANIERIFWMVVELLSKQVVERIISLGVHNLLNINH